MVSTTEAVILGIVQGITEWLPVSSSGHLAILQNFLSIDVPVLFDVLLHIGSLIVVLLVFWKDIFRLIQGLLKLDPKAWKFAFYLALASIPIALVGYFLNDYVKSAFHDLTVIGLSLIFTSIVLLMSRFPHKNTSNLVLKNTYIIGLFQAIAILPGVSRSGVTISSALMQGVDKRKAAFFSFMLFVPAILGATLLEFRHVDEISNITAMIVGMIAVVISGYISLKVLLRIIEKGKFHYFGFYCLILGLIVFLL